MKTFFSKLSLQFFLVFVLMSATFTSCNLTINKEQANEQDEEISSPIILGVNAYSFADLLQARGSRYNEPVYTLFNLLDWCKSQGIRAIDPTGYFFPSYPEVPSDEYLARFKEKADDLGIAISGTGIRNNFASPDPAVRSEGVELAKKWIVVASKLGAPVIRLFAGAIPEGYEDNWEEPAGWMIDCYKELLPYAERYGVKIGIQNHGDMLQTAEQCLYVLERVDSEWAGIIVDTGSFLTEDPYEDIAATVPYAVNWQVKEFTKGTAGSVRIDYNKFVRILKEQNYRGYLPVETLHVKGEFYDPFQRVNGMLESLKTAISEVYSDLN